MILDSSGSSCAKKGKNSRFRDKLHFCIFLSDLNDVSTKKYLLEVPPSYVVFNLSSQVGSHALGAFKYD